MNLLAFFGPVPPGGTDKLPGVLLLGVGILGLLSLPSQIKALQSRRKITLYAIVAFDALCVIAGIVMLTRSH